MFFTQLRQAFVMLILLTILTGILYPLAVTGIAQMAFPSQANGSLIVSSDGKDLGSSLIGQSFDDPNISGAGIGDESGLIMPHPHPVPILGP